MLKGEEEVTLPVKVPPPLLVTVNVRSLEPFTVTLPKAKAVVLTDKAGAGVPVPLRLTVVLPTLELMVAKLRKAPVLVGLKRTVTT
jgi:hypothetical protein